LREDFEGTHDAHQIVLMQALRAFWIVPTRPTRLAG